MPTLTTLCGPAKVLIGRRPVFLTVLSPFAHLYPGLYGLWLAWFRVVRPCMKFRFWSLPIALKQLVLLPQSFSANSVLYQPGTDTRMHARKGMGMIAWTGTCMNTRTATCNTYALVYRGI